MKKIVLLMSVAFSFVATSCYTTKNVVSDSMYDACRNQVAANMEANGYALSGENHEEKNEVVVTGQSYSNYSGYGTKMDNNFQQYDTYRFADKDGQTAEYTVKYHGVRADNGSYALADVQVLGCKTSKAADYSKVCNGKYSPASVIGNMPTDATKTDLDVATTTVAVTGVATLVSLVICLLML